MSKAKKETVETVETTEIVDAVETIEATEIEQAPEGCELTFAEVMAWQRNNRHLMPPLKELPARPKLTHF